MPFGYSREIFKYPAVQYIPLRRNNEKVRNIDRITGKTRAYVYNYMENEDLNKKLRYLQFDGNYNIKKGELAVLVLNGKVNLVQYRGYEVIMVGKEIPGTYHLLTVTADYFYKDKVIFILYNEVTSERVDLVRVNEPTKNL